MFGGALKYPQVLEEACGLGSCKATGLRGEGLQPVTPLSESYGRLLCSTPLERNAVPTPLLQSLARGKRSILGRLGTQQALEERAPR